MLDVEKFSAGFSWVLRRRGFAPKRPVTLKGGELPQKSGNAYVELCSF
jgi:hypothetical protein